MFEEERQKIVGQILSIKDQIRKFPIESCEHNYGRDRISSLALALTFITMAEKGSFLVPKV